MTTHVPPQNLVTEAARLNSAGRAPTKLKTRIGRTYRFESAHHLPLVPEGHKCKNMHGHNYRMDVVVRGNA